jgi:hypothetical protein
MRAAASVPVGMKSAARYLQLRHHHQHGHQEKKAKNCSIRRKEEGKESDQFDFIVTDEQPAPAFPFHYW